MRRGNGHWIMARGAGVMRRKLRRSVCFTVAIVPALSEMIADHRGHFAINWLRKLDNRAVLMDMKSRWKLNGITGKADTLKRTVIDRIGSPTSHARDVKL